MSQAPSVPPKQPGVDAVARLMGELHPKLQTKADFIVFAVHSAILAGGWKTFSEDGKGPSLQFIGCMFCIYIGILSSSWFSS